MSSSDINRLREVYAGRRHSKTDQALYSVFNYSYFFMLQQCQMRPRQFAPALLVSVFLGGDILSLLHRSLKRLWLTFLATYGISSLAASILSARQAGWRHLPLLPFVFIALHFSYGLGFINGLVKFRNRWRE